MRADGSAIDNPYSAALVMNVTITRWVKKCILAGRTWGERAAQYRFFFRTAKVSFSSPFVAHLVTYIVIKLCLKSFNNFSSMSAIVAALRWRDIEGMKVTQKAVVDCHEKLLKMSNIAANSLESYVIAFKKARFRCIPILGAFIDPATHDLYFI